MNASNALEELILKYFFTPDAVTRPTTWFLGYGTAGADTGVTEPVGNGYAREAVVFGSPVESPSGTWKVSNTGQIDFDAASGGNHGTITHLGVWTALTSGIHLCWIPLAISQVIDDGNNLKVLVGGATIEAQ